MQDYHSGKYKISIEHFWFCLKGRDNQLYRLYNIGVGRRTIGVFAV